MRNAHRRMAMWLAVAATTAATACGNAIDSGYYVDGDDGGGEGGGDVEDDRTDIRRDDAEGGDVDGAADADADDDGGDVSPRCGDGVLDPEEECDDGAENSDTTPDACRTDCRTAHCGDAVTDTGEGCDDGNDVDTDDCRTDCSLPSCGDGLVQEGEDCDDGNDVDTDDCLSTCTTASCGDGVVWEDHEECDGAATEDCATVCGSTGSRECLDCAFGEICVPPTETCNALDDDCDTLADDGYDCAAGTTTTCTTPCDTTGTGTCTGACTAPPAADCTPPAESCNAADDDCDTLTDDGFACVPGTATSCTTTCGSAGTGTCTAACTLPAGADCAPPAETCNGVDDDCAGGCDDAFSCCRGSPVACTTTCGTAGSGVCDTSCNPPSGAACTPPAESCNAADDDCDTLVDDGFACVRGTSVACRTTCGSAGSGLCTAACELPTGAACTPPAESCNAADDDCDTLIDDGFACAAGDAVLCTTTCGTTGTGVCTASCAIPAPASCTPPAESCNAADDDCDTLTDETFACVRGATRACTVGACSGTQTCSNTCTWGSCGPGTPPTNDACTSPGIVSIPSSNGTYNYAGSTCGATNDYAYFCSMIGGGGPDIVYRLELPTSRSVTIDTIGSGFDAILFLRSGAACPGSALTCDDNSAGGTPGQARITRTLAAGTYWIIVDGTSATQTGSYTLNVVVADTPVAPPNDACAGAITLLPNSTLQSVTGDTTAALDDNVGCLGTGGRDVWYRFTLPVPHAVYLSTAGGATWDTVLHVRSGSCTGALTSYGCADDACGSLQSMFLGILPAGTYYVAVDGYSAAAGGPFTLYYQANTCVAAVDANTATPTVIDPIRVSGTYTGSTVGQGNDSSGTCAGGAGQIAADVYYYVGLCPSRTATMTTCSASTNFDTVLYARYGTCSLAFMPDTACNNNDAAVGCSTPPVGSFASRISFGATGQGLYYVWVDGWVDPMGILPWEGNYALIASGM